jgi:multimeric flavodoxin WrbA
MPAVVSLDDVGPVTADALAGEADCDPDPNGGERMPTDGLAAAEPTDYSDLRALYVNCTLKRSPHVSNTQGLADRSIAIMRRNGVSVDVVRAVDHDIATGVWPDMTEHGWASDEWPQLFERVLAADILVLCTPIWLGEKSSVCTRVVERLYGNSHLLNDAGQYAYYGRVGGCLVTGNEDGVKHCAMGVLYALQHLGYTIPPQADAGWIGAAGPGPSYLDPGSGGPDNDFTNRNTTFMTWNLLHLARMLKDAGGVPAHGNQRSEWDAGCRFDYPNPEHPVQVPGVPDEAPRRRVPRPTFPPSAIGRSTAATRSERASLPNPSRVGTVDQWAAARPLSRDRGAVRCAAMAIDSASFCRDVLCGPSQRRTGRSGASPSPTGTSAIVRAAPKGTSPSRVMRRPSC